MLIGWILYLFIAQQLLQRDEMHEDRPLRAAEFGIFGIFGVTSYEVDFFPVSRQRDAGTYMRVSPSLLSILASTACSGFKSG